MNELTTKNIIRSHKSLLTCGGFFICGRDAKFYFDEIMFFNARGSGLTQQNGC